MADPVDSGPDPHDLSRFVDAQAGDYEQALAEIRTRPEAVALDLVHLPADRGARLQLDVPALLDQVP